MLLVRLIINYNSYNTRATHLDSTCDNGAMAGPEGVHKGPYTRGRTVILPVTKGPSTLGVIIPFFVNLLGNVCNITCVY